MNAIPNATLSDSDALKQSIRDAAKRKRAALANRASLSKQIASAVLALPEFKNAGTVMAYVNTQNEVHTSDVIMGLIQRGKRLCVPYCVEDHLELYAITQPTELVRGSFGIMEPPANLRRSHHRVATKDVDLFLVPGVAFDNQGTRLGHGRGYFDRLLAEARPDAKIIGLGYQCQISSEPIPCNAHDVQLHVLVTEERVLRWNKG